MKEKDLFWISLLCLCISGLITGNSCVRAILACILMFIIYFLIKLKRRRNCASGSPDSPGDERYIPLMVVGILILGFIGLLGNSDDSTQKSSQKYYSSLSTRKSSSGSTASKKATSSTASSAGTAKTSDSGKTAYSTPSGKGSSAADSYDVNSYYAAEDFADEWGDEFDDWDEAFDYWEDNH